MLEQIADEIPARKQSKETLLASILSLLTAFSSAALYTVPFVLLPLDKISTALILRLLSWPFIIIACYLLFRVLISVFNPELRKRWRVRVAGLIAIPCIFFLILDILTRPGIVIPWRITYS
jgi:hypothetical protein